MNEEYVFADAAALIFEGQWHALEEFFTYQANSLGLPAIAAFIAYLFDAAPSVSFLRVIVLTGCLAAAWGLSLIGERIYRSNLTWIWLSCLLINPAVWCMLGYGTADLLPAILSSLAYLLLLASPCQLSTIRQNWTIICGSTLFCLATILKMHAFFFAGWAALHFVMTSPRLLSRWSHAFVIILPAASWLGLYAVWTKQSFGFMLVPTHFQETHFSGRASQAPITFSLYVAFMACMLGPLALGVLGIRRIRRWMLLTAAVVMVSAWYGSALRLGEMDFGIFTEVFPPSVFQMVIAFMAGLGTLVGCVLVESAMKQPKLRNEAWIIFGCIAYLAAMSASRPAQRYLVFILPTVLWLVLQTLETTMSSRKRWTCTIAYIALFFPISLAGQSFLASQGTAAQDLVATTQDLDLLCRTDLSGIRQHVGPISRWCDSPETPKYVVTNHDDRNVIAKRDIRVFGITVRSLYLIELPSPSNGF